MGATLVSNNSSVAAQFNLQNATNKLQSSIARLSSGNRITKAGDDVASLAVGTQFRAFVNILKAGYKNAGQATSMLGVADGALQAIGEILQRQSSLASQASSGALDENARLYLDQEFQGLVEEVDRIAENTNFNNIKMINGNLDKIAGDIETATDVTDTDATLKLKFGNNQAKFYNVGANNFTTTTAGSAIVRVTVPNHGLSNADSVTFLMTSAGPFDGITAANINGAKAITVIDEDTFEFTAGGTATAGSTTFGANGDGFSLAASLTKSVDLLDGNVLTINGVDLTAKNADVIANNYTGAAGEIRTTSGQSAAQLAQSVKDGIDNYITKKGAGYEKLLGLKVELNPLDNSELVITSKAKGVAGDTLFAKTSAGAMITGGPTKYVNNSTFKATGGATSSLTQMNTEVYGTLQDGIVNTLAGVKATASFTIATNPVYNANTPTAINAGNSTINATGTAVKVNISGHGYKGGETLTVTGGAYVFASTGMSLADGNYTVRVLDQDNFEFYGAGLTGTFTGFQGAAPGAITYTHAAADIGDKINVNGKEFRYVRAVDYLGGDDEIVIGADIAETTKNTVEVLNKSKDPKVAQATYSGVTTTGVITATFKAKGAAADNVFTLGGAMRSTNLTITNSTLTGGTATTGIDFSRVTNNDDFVGTLKGFTAKYNLNDNIDLSIKVGDYTYTAKAIDSTPTANSWITFNSEDGGGSFKIEMAANKGQAVTNQADADMVAKRLDLAFSQLKVTQRREITTFDSYGDINNGATKVGSLSGASVFFTNDDFKDIQISSISFKAPGAGQTDAKVTVTINGENYVAPTGIGSTIDKGSLLKLTNENDNNRFVELRIGNTDLDLTTAGNAAAIQDAYTQALKIGSAKDAGVEFQIGTETTDKIKVKISSAKTSDIYKDENDKSVPLSIATKEEADKAISIIQRAITKVTSIRAQVGVYQSRFDYASAAINSSIQNQDAARSEFLDTKVEEESAALTENRVRMDASISVLAQANQITQALLQLLRS